MKRSSFFKALAAVIISPKLLANVSTNSNIIMGRHTGSFKSKKSSTIYYFSKDFVPTTIDIHLDYCVKEYFRRKHKW